MLARFALDRMLKSLFQEGTLRVVMPSGDVLEYGDGTGAPAMVQIHDAATVRHLALNPELALGEAYTDGTLTIEGNDLHGFLALAVRNVQRLDADPVWWQKALVRVRVALRKLAQNNVVHRARRNVAHHYDLSGRLYDLFLDEDRQYSCAYFREPDATLEQAQADKKHHIARKLQILPGMRVLDIGCGWGGMARTLARDYGAHVVGITLSQEQHAYATRRNAEEGLADRIDIRLCDYREVEGQFDRIVSVGMFEHVGLPHFDAFFATLRQRLTPDGIALLHTIGWAGPASATNPWIAKYIFPGGYIPTVSEVMGAVEGARLWATDIECWRLHYAHTLHHWLERFSAHEDEVEAMYDARFVRLWRFYLAACEQTFRHGPQAVFQFQLSRRVDAVPLTRDYLYADAPEVAQAPRAASQATPLHGSGAAVRKTAPQARRKGKSHVIPFKEQSNDRQNTSGR